MRELVTAPAAPAPPAVRCASPPPAAPLASARKLTVPRSPLLSTAQRAGHRDAVTAAASAAAAAAAVAPSASKKRPRDCCDSPTPAPREAGGRAARSAAAPAATSPFVALAQQVHAFQHATPPRFKRGATAATSSTPAPAPTPRTLTRAVSPVFATVARARPSALKSATQREAELLAAVPLFKARAFDSAVNPKPPPFAAPAPVTMPAPFVFSTEVRAATRSRTAHLEGGASGSASARIPRTSLDGGASFSFTPRRLAAPGVPAMATAARAAARCDASRAVATGELPVAVTPFRARPAPSCARPWAPDPSQAAPLVDVAPFALATDKRGAAYMRQLADRVAAQDALAHAARDVKARPMPAQQAQLSGRMAAPSRAPGELPGDAIHAAAVAQLAKRREATAEALQAQRTQHKARGVPRSARVPFVAQPSGCALTEVCAQPLASDARAQRRAAFDAHNAQRVQQEAMQRAAAAQARAECEAQEMKVQRRTELVHKAAPAPATDGYHPPCASKRPLTQPTSPLLGNKRRCTYRF